MDTENHVAKLNEHAQRAGLEVKYEDVGPAAPDHMKPFNLRVVLNGKAYPAGGGINKKEAKQNAAKNALRGLLEEAADSTENAAEASTSPVHPTSISSNNYIGWLYDYGQKNGLSIKTVEKPTMGPYGPTQKCSFVVGDKEYPAAYGKTKKEAKQEAAKRVYNEIYGDKTTETGDEMMNRSGISTPQKGELNQSVSDICDQIKNLPMRTEDNSFTEINFIGMINQYCQERNLSRTFVEKDIRGPPNTRQFFYKLLIDNKDYPVAEGRSIKKAKQNAAQLAWNVLMKHSDSGSEVSQWQQKTTRRGSFEHQYFNISRHENGSPEVAASSAVCDDGSPAKLSTSQSTLDSGHAESSSTTTATSDSVVFTNSSKPSKDQCQKVIEGLTGLLKVQSPAVKLKIRISANFENADRHSKEVIVNFKAKNTGNTQSEKSSTQSGWFTTQFDSIERLGKGAFGRVFKARQKLLEKDFAIKIVRCKEKALEEAKALSHLSHPNIVRYYTCWLEDSEYQWDSTADSCSSSHSTSSSDSSVNYLYIQMELCDTNLRVWIDEKNTQNVEKSLQDAKRREESLTIVQQILSAVEYIHSKMFIHRDLKPANIMFGRDGEIKIGDFGLVTADNDGDAENLIVRTAYTGTPTYMAPEQKNRSTYDRKVDIFALGLIYFELLWNLCTGHERGVIWNDARNQKLPQEFSHHFHQETRLIKSMLCAKPEDRPEASKLKTDLEECKHSLTMPKYMHTV